MSQWHFPTFQLQFSQTITCASRKANCVKTQTSTKIYALN